MCWSLSCHVTNDSLLLQVAEEQPSYAKRASGSSIPRRHLLCHSRQTTFDYRGTLACVALWLCVTIWWLERSRKPARGPITNAAGRVACSYWLTANIKKKRKKKEYFLQFCVLLIWVEVSIYCSKLWEHLCAEPASVKATQLLYCKLHFFPSF